MPGSIKMSRHYSSQRAFRRDSDELEAEGWTLESVHELEREGPFAFLGLARQPVDAEYVRREWPVE
jgi:hypothetical protein